ncbi:uncharacterized protein ARMOST_00069 [Armillaria ostoyae]|uniref:Uncharacterized protein n=1 Tax=Armillaria ostoyae TaxID=47428 RepID=A0A284QK35_ARMOS|nr:uncharacterized protein ARMOST_00069 [Armillaria ostoyae]
MLSLHATCDRFSERVLPTPPDWRHVSPTLIPSHTHYTPSSNKDPRYPNPAHRLLSPFHRFTASLSRSRIKKTTTSLTRKTRNSSSGSGSTGLQDLYSNDVTTIEDVNFCATTTDRRPASEELDKSMHKGRIPLQQKLDDDLRAATMFQLSMTGERGMMASITSLHVFETSNKDYRIDTALLRDVPRVTNSHVGPGPSGHFFVFPDATLHQDGNEELTSDAFL